MPCRTCVELEEALRFAREPSPPDHLMGLNAAGMRNRVHQKQEHLLRSELNLGKIESRANQFFRAASLVRWAGARMTTELSIEPLSSLPSVFTAQPEASPKHTQRGDKTPVLNVEEARHSSP